MHFLALFERQVNRHHELSFCRGEHVPFGDNPHVLAERFSVQVLKDGASVPAPGAGEALILQISCNEAGHSAFGALNKSQNGRFSFGVLSISPKRAHSVGSAGW